MVLTGVLAGLGTFGAMTTAAHQISLRYASDYYSPLYDPPTLTSVIVAAYNEEKYLPRALSSLKAQNIIQALPERFELIVVDSGSTDRTATIAEDYGFKVIQAGRGKLTARDTATKAAQGDTIFAADADTYYPSNVLNLILRHFQDPQVVATFSPRWNEGFPIEQLQAIQGIFAPVHKLHGSNSSFDKASYETIGGFNLNINQQDLAEIFAEEETNFVYRLSKLGLIEYENAAPVLTSTRRWFFNGSDPKYRGEVERGERF